ncbi:MAG: hypothetical protein JRC68_09015 [Deltaproteobacteria bacterium]|nr:hypothetical protein [Deltaproteobacteria bacterium]
MRRYIFILLGLLLLFPSTSKGESFLGAPVIPQAKTVQQTDTRSESKTGLSHDDVVEFYREALKGYKDIKFREWKDSTYIEDDGGLDWHSITISKGQEETTITIVKDNWTWIIGTLILRYIGVFAVLLVLFLGMSISGIIISRSIEKLEAGKTAD